MFYIYTIEDYWAIKKNEIMPFAEKWMEQETLMLSEANEKEKDKKHMLLHIWNLIYGTNEYFYMKKIMDIEKRLVVAKGEGDGVGGTVILGLIEANYCIWNG